MSISQLNTLSKINSLIISVNKMIPRTHLLADTGISGKDIGILCNGKSWWAAIRDFEHASPLGKVTAILLILGTMLREAIKAYRENITRCWYPMMDSITYLYIAYGLFCTPAHKSVRCLEKSSSAPLIHFYLVWWSLHLFHLEQLCLCPPEARKHIHKLNMRKTNTFLQ